MSKPVKKLASKPAVVKKTSSKVSKTQSLARSKRPAPGMIKLSRTEPEPAKTGIKFDSEKPRYVIVPATIRRALTPACSICSRSAASYAANTVTTLNSAGEASALCLRMAIDSWYTGWYVESLIWISRFFLIQDGYDYMDVGYPLAGLDRAIAIMEHGAAKYGLDNWKDMADWDRYESAGDRHLGPYLAGQMFDKDSGLEHLAHWQCNILFRAWKQLKDRSEDQGQALHRNCEIILRDLI